MKRSKLECIVSEFEIWCVLQSCLFVRRFGGFIAAESVASGVLLGAQLLCSFGCFLVLFLWKFEAGVCNFGC